MGNARAFKDMFEGSVLFDKTTGKWMTWDGKRWSREDGDIQVQLYCRGVEMHWHQKLGVCETKEERKDIFKHWQYTSSATGVRNLLYLAKSEPGIAVSGKDKLDTCPYLLNVQDGTVDLRTGEIRPHDPNDLITQMANVAYRKDLEYPATEKWTASLGKWHPHGGDDGTWDYLQMLMGYCLTGDIGSRCFPIFWGSGKNGKNAFLDTFLLMLGDYATIAARTLVEAMSQEQHPTEIADLWKKRLVLASEPKKGTKLKIGLVKAMTGDSMLKARFMRQDFFEFKPTHKVIMMTQNLPIVDETEDAIWDRLHKLEWGVRISSEEQIPNYSDGYLKEEWTGILRWAISGYLKLQKTPQGFLQPTKKIEQETRDYRDEQNPAQKFVEFNYILNSKMYAPVAEVNLRMSEWIQTMDDKLLMTKSDVISYLRGKGCAQVTKRINGNLQKIWVGIGSRAR